MNCILCKVANKEIKSYVVCESGQFVSVLDIHPHAPGHSLVIPKNHIENFVDLPENLHHEFIQVIKETLITLSKALNTTDFTLGINEGPLAGRAIPHLHFHILPRFPNDGGGSIHTVVKNIPEGSLEEIYQKIINVRKS